MLPKIGEIVSRLALLSLASLAALAALAACSSSDEADGAETTFSRGEYTVPVDPALAHVATNDVDKVALREKDDGRYRLVYKLPRVLAGFDKLVDLDGDRNEAGEIVLSGAAGTATCTKSDRAVVTCNEHLTGITVDLEQVGQALDERGILGADRADYLEVARRFSIDPLGVLTFEQR